MDNTISSSVYSSQATSIDSTGIYNSKNSTTPANNQPLSQQDDTVSLSPEAISKYSQKEGEASSANPSKTSTKENAELSADELREIQKLQQRDTEVKAHEQAHLSTAGQYAAGGASFSYTTGPNGKRYATGGEVPIDLSKEKDPQETLAKMAQVRRAALAPANPSSADRSIAARASMIAAQAMREMSSLSGTNADRESSAQDIKNINTDDHKTSAVSTNESRTLSISDDTIPANTRHRVLQAYSAHS